MYTDGKWYEAKIVSTIQSDIYQISWPKPNDTIKHKSYMRAKKGAAPPKVSNTQKNY